MLSLFECLLFSILLVFIGILGIIINKRNIISILLCLEIILLGVSTSFISFSYFKGDIVGQIFVFFILTISAVEASVGLAIVVTLFRKSNSIDISTINELKG